MTAERNKSKTKERQRRKTDESAERSRIREVKWPTGPPGSDLVRRLNEQPDSEPARRISALILKIKRIQDLERTRTNKWLAVSKDLISLKRKAKEEGYGTSWENYEYYFTEGEIRRMEYMHGVRDPVFMEVSRLALEIKTELDHFNFLPRLHVSAFRTGVNWIPPVGQRGDPTYRMVARVLTLAEHDWLRWIERCERCEQWFSARRPRYQKFCSESCQQAQYKSTPEWRAHRAQYMRHYRRTTGQGGK
jgi:hypothetical protein